MKSDTVLINLDIKIINTLLDKYERSRIFHAENKRKIRISLKLSDGSNGFQVTSSCLSENI